MLDRYTGYIEKNKNFITRGQVPSSSENLISVSRIDSKGGNVVFERNSASIYFNSPEEIQQEISQEARSSKTVVQLSGII